MLLIVSNRKMALCFCCEWWKEVVKSCKISVPTGDIKEIVLNKNMIPETAYNNNKKNFYQLL